MHEFAVQTELPPMGEVKLGRSGARPEQLFDEASQHGQRIEDLVEQIERLPDTAARALAQDCIHSVLAFYGDGLARILQLVGNAGDRNENAYDALIEDKHVRGLLLIHGLHPVSLEARLGAALDRVRPYMESHGGNVELISLEEGFAKLRLQGSCKSCPSSAMTMELAVRNAIEEACPDLAGFDVEGVPAQEPSVHPPEWVLIERAPELSEGAFMRAQAAGVPLIICKRKQNLYAYRDHCSACNVPLHTGVLEKGILSCSSGHAWDIERAGRSASGSATHLNPYPLLMEDGQVKVSVG
jgi:Fe-S cluster biogenesis protein NfuA/nitrite reductase/ring-hydroxylating ferredoxin subunit